MSNDIDYLYFVTQRKRNPAWNLLRANHSPFILAFIHEAFITKGRTSAPESELVDIMRDIIFRINGGRLSNQNAEEDNEHRYEDLLDEIYGAKFGENINEEESSEDDLDESEEKESSTRKRRSNKNLASSKELDQRPIVDDPIRYLRAWSSEETRFLRCSYLGSSNDEPQYDVTPEMQKAYSFIVGMDNESGTNFVPTESRFKELLDILKEVHMSTEGTADLYLEELYKKREEIDKEIEKAQRGEIKKLSRSEIRERFLQFQHDAIQLVDDFRQVEYNLSALDKEIMQDILSWTKPRGELLDKYFDQNAYIEGTDQGRSVRSFSRLLLSSNDDEMIVRRIKNLLSLEEVADLKKDERIYNIHDQWLDLRLNIDRVMAASTKRIKSFLQPANLDANRFLKERIKSITDKIGILTKEYGKDCLDKPMFDLEVPVAEIFAPQDKGLALPPTPIEFDTEAKEDNFNVDDNKLFDQVVVDSSKLMAQIDYMMGDRLEVPLVDVVNRFPLEYGITELTYYVKLAMNNYDVIEDKNKEDVYKWETIDHEGNRVVRVARLKHITLKCR